MPLCHRAVHGDRLARFHDHKIAFLHFRKRNRHLRAAAFHRNGVGRKGQELFHFSARFPLTLIFEPFAEAHERNDHRRRLEIQHAAFADTDSHERIDKRNACAERYERIHIRNAL